MCAITLIASNSMDANAACSHTPAAKVTKQPGCFSTGTRTIACTKCKVVIRTESIPSLGGHAWDKGTITKKATCATIGTIQYRCTRSGCRATKTVEYYVQYCAE